MSKYDYLDARTELEQIITKDLQDALSKRGFTVVHHGTEESHAPGGHPDIEFFNAKYAFTVEVTKLKKSSQDREFQSIRDHLNGLKERNSSKQCFCLFVSPETSQRTIDSFKDYNQQRQSERKKDLKLVPLNFETLELWLTKLRESESALYPIDHFVKLFDQHNEFIDDLRVRKLLAKMVFPSDTELDDAIRKQETEHDEKTLEILIKDLRSIEEYMRQNGVATSQNAIDNLIYLVFLKLYEEKREKDGHGKNRLRSVEAFDDYLQNFSQKVREDGRGIHELFKQVKEEGEFITSKMFSPNDSLVDSLTDDFIKDKILPIFSSYTFVGTKIDALGAVYEVLALRADKDVKVGQFFTPENVVKFMVKLAEFQYDDRVLDPACGTGRFLIHAMDDMLHKLERSSERKKSEKDKHIREHQCFGSDIDTRIAKIAKMNMWIHGDGKSNIFGGRDYNGLLLHRKGFNGGSTFDNSFDIVLSNPPLGELDYQVLHFSDPPTADSAESEVQRYIRDKFTRMPILPRKNVTAEKLETVEKRLVEYETELSKLRQQLEQMDDSVLYDKQAYKKLRSAIDKKQATIDKNRNDADTLRALLKTGKEEWEITGTKMKGGAMFLAAIWQYLKTEAYPDEKPEWRGGKMLIVLDEGVLNTDNYSEVRQFVRENFYLKAVISLTRDTFMPISKTSTKTSILYAVKKTDPLAVQQEPIFFAHVERVGLDTKGKVSANDLDSVLAKYQTFKEAVLSSYQGFHFRRERFIAQMPNTELM